jgi:hypothetical protein
VYESAFWLGYWKARLKRIRQALDNWPRLKNSEDTMKPTDHTDQATAEDPQRFKLTPEEKEQALEEAVIHLNATREYGLKRPPATENEEKLSRMD